MATIGIRREDKSIWERRVPLVPEDVARLVGEGVHIVVQPSTTRIFADHDFRTAGAILSEDLAACDVILGIKEIPLPLIQPSKTYMLFSHTIKGQPANMPMLRSLLERGCSLLDHELVTDDDGRRLIAFGRHAGMAGTIDALWILGRRLRHEGIANPFETMRQSVDYADLDGARAAVRQVGEAIRRDGLPREITPVRVRSDGARKRRHRNPRHSQSPPARRSCVPTNYRGARERANPDGHEVVIAHCRTEDLVEPLAGAFLP